MKGATVLPQLARRTVLIKTGLMRQWQTPHPAFHHPVFDHLRALARSDRMTAGQFAQLRATVLASLPSGSHPELAQALNSVARHVFKLPPISREEALSCESMKAYAQEMGRLGENRGAYLRIAQDQMSAHLANLLKPIFLAFADRMEKGVFERDVGPACLLDGNPDIPQGAVRQQAQIDTALHVADLFADAQAQVFDNLGMQAGCQLTQARLAPPQGIHPAVLLPV
jgi:hypothetical protein